MTADIDAMRGAIGAAFPDLALSPVTVHDGGWDSVAIEVGEWLCKFPRDDDAIAALRREAALLRIVRPHLTIAVPDMTMVDGPLPFTRHRMLRGDPVLGADYIGWDDDRRAALGEDVARFLAELHGIADDRVAPWIEAGDDEDDDHDDDGPDDAAALMLLPPALRPVAERVIADHAALGDDPLGTGLCYLDAHGRNFAYDRQRGRLAGIFDFGDADIAGRHEEFVEPAYIARDCARRVIAGYERATGAVVDRRRVDLLIGRQRLEELAGDADHPRHGPLVRSLADDWFRAPTLDAPDRR